MREILLGPSMVISNHSTKKYLHDDTANGVLSCGQLIDYTHVVLQIRLNTNKVVCAKIIVNIVCKECFLAKLGELSLGPIVVTCKHDAKKCCMMMLLSGGSLTHDIHLVLQLKLAQLTQFCVQNL